MKILIVTLPQRSAPSIFPPLGALSVVNYTRRHFGQRAEVEFLNLDVHRAEFETTIADIASRRPDIVGISAVVSTAYAYTKRLSLAIKERLPGTLVVVGGNMAASAEILLRKAGVDVCVLGEGERVFVNLVERYGAGGGLRSLADVKGLMLLDEQGRLVNTGYEAPLKAEEIWDVDWADLERTGCLDVYMPVLEEKDLFGGLVPAEFVPADEGLLARMAAAGVRYGSVTCAKGCVARCTFCHRWDKGIRHIPVDEVMRRLDHLIEKYNVGVVEMIAESFGSDKRWLDEFLEKIARRNVLWLAGGVRTSVASPEWIERMKAAGCYSIMYGNETGSGKMLEVMEKKVTLEDNYNASQWTVDAGLVNGVQLVIGMPGESPETIRETIEYVKFATSIAPNQDPSYLSINYAQALPGTPLYEFGRAHGLIGKDLESEERYLMSISDKDAADPLTCINFTNYPRLTLLSWSMLIRIHVREHYLRKFGRAHYNKKLLATERYGSFAQDVRASLAAGEAPPLPAFVRLLVRGRLRELMACYPTLFYRLRHFAGMFTLLNIFRSHGLGPGLDIAADYLRHLLRLAIRPWRFDYRSLRKIMDEEVPPLPNDSPQMMPLRKGR